MKRFFLSLVTVIACLGFSSGSYAADQVASPGKQITLHYTLTVGGNEIESSQKAGEPVKYIYGQGQMIPGFEIQIAGAKKGEKRSFEVPPGLAYGLVNPQAFMEVKNEEIPEDLEVKLGQQTNFQNEQGQTFPAVVWEIKEETVVFNLNHPLAGQSLQFDVEILDVADAPAQE